MDQESLGRCGSEDLTDTVGQLHGISCAAHRHLLSVVAELQRRDAFADDGVLEMAEWLSARLSLSRRTARAWVEVAGALESLPAIAAAYEAGRLSWDQVQALARVATPETEGELAAEARGCSAAQIEALAGRLRRVSAEDAGEQHFKRSLTWSWDDDHVFMRLSGRLPAEYGAVVETALTRVMDTTPPSPGGVYEEWPARAADALVELCSQRLDVDFDADRATVIAHVDASVLAGSDGSGELTNGATLSEEAIRRLACDARVQAVVHGCDGTPLGVGRLSRTVPHWLARQVRHRDRTCRFPGCFRTRFTDNHHIKFWGSQGPTDLDNLVMLCRYHHRLVHDDGWSVRGDPAGKLAFMTPDGRELEAGPPALRPEIRRRLFPDDDDLGSDDAEAC